MSEVAKHTPGPWSASGPFPEARSGVQAIEIGAETPAGHLSVAWVFGFGPGEDVDAAWADARLMAAAPDLLAERDRLRLALTALLTAVERVAMTHRWTDSAGSWESLHDLPPDVATLAIVARAARTALAKAEGRDTLEENIAQYGPLVPECDGASVTADAASSDKPATNLAAKPADAAKEPGT